MGSSDHVSENFIRLIENQSLLGGRYESIRRLTEEAGNGSFSLIFRAADRQTNSPVALKFFNPIKSSDSYRLKCFERESDILKLLSGKPNVLELVEPRTSFTYELNDPATGLSLAYQFQYFAVKLATCSLTDYIYSDEWDPLQALVLFRETCKGIQRLHWSGIAHRDLKPDNLLLFGRDDLRLSDFGAAKVMGAQVPSLRSSYYAPSGDLRYTAPELLALLNFEDHFTYRSDIFALGCILFELFTGTVLTLELYGLEKMHTLIDDFSHVPRSSRLYTFDGMIEGINEQIQLPEMELVTDRVPACISLRLNRLYRSLAALDYRKREVHFTRIFNEINICTLILQNEKKYRQWLALRKLLRERAQQKCAANAQTRSEVVCD